MFEAEFQQFQLSGHMPPNSAAAQLSVILSVMLNGAHVVRWLPANQRLRRAEQTIGWGGSW